MSTARGSLGAALCLLLCAGSSYADSSRFTTITDEWRDPVYRQYDFWVGLGSANWRQKKPDEFFHDDQGFRATHWVYPTLNGKALLEFAMSDDVLPSGSRIQGLSVRYYDETKQRWVMAQEWPNQNATTGVVDQLQGFYRFGRVQVFSTYTIGDPPVERTRRYTFSDIRPEGFIWHGVSTGDYGKTWSAGTLVEFSRIEAEATWPDVGGPFHNFDDAKQCDKNEYRAFDALEGTWAGSMTVDGKESNARLTGYRMLGGCAVLSYLEWSDNIDANTLLEVRSMNGDQSEWWTYQLDSKKGTAHS